MKTLDIEETKYKVRYYLINKSGLVYILWLYVLFLPIGMISFFGPNNVGIWEWQEMKWFVIGSLTESGDWYLVTRAFASELTRSDLADSFISAITLSYILSNIFLTFSFRKFLKGYSSLLLSGLSIMLMIVGPFILSANPRSTYLYPMPAVVLPQILFSLGLISRPGWFDKVKEQRRGDSYEAVDLPDLKILRCGEFVGNRFRFKVKTVNTGNVVLNDITISLISYPKDSLKLTSDRSRTIDKLKPDGFRSPTFDLLPTQDCVKGTLIASVSFIDHRGDAHSATTDPYEVRSVCDLLTAEQISPDDFELQITSLNHGEASLKVEDWTPEEMHSKTLKILDESNFFEVDSRTREFDDHTEITVKGWARGKYTGKAIGVEIRITGKEGEKGATCKIEMSGEDEAMIMPAIDEISQSLNAWLCPICGAKLPPALVDELRAGKSCACPFCSVTMDR